MAWCAGAALSSACEQASTPCTGYPDQQTSAYVLPWPAGEEHSVLTGNCRGDISTHSGDRRYAYDFRMPPGTVFTAARGGTDPPAPLALLLAA